MACSHDCSTCSSECSSRDKHENDVQDFSAKLNAASSVKKVIGVVSGKGGVGKSLVSSLLAVALQKAGRQVGILDADITGPSIPKMFGVSGKATGTDKGILPAVTKSGTKIMSINLLLENETEPVVWRGPVIAGAVQQFWTDVFWDSIDVMVVDMPPGTGDVPLTVFQSLPVDGIIIVTSPQELVSMIVQKAVKMANMMNIPILGMVENMSYVQCPDCGSQIHVFGESHIHEVAASYGIDVLGQLPIDPAFAAHADSGTIEQADTAGLKAAVDKI